MLTVGRLWAVMLACGLLMPMAYAQTAAKQDIAGNWLGALDAGQAKLRLLVKIGGQPGALSGTMDSLDQSASGMPLTTIMLQGDTLHFEIASIQGAFDGKRSADGQEFVGTWTQGVNALPLTLRRTDQVPAPPRRPQEPKPPFPYHVKDVAFPDAKDGVSLAGTLTTPKGHGPSPAVVLVSGSGPNGRDEDVFGHKIFLVLADYLTRHGTAVLRYDKRGIGQSTGNYALATRRDFTDDALATVRYLKTVPRVRATQIGMVGHSEGGLIAPLAAVRSKDIAFIVLLAGPGLPGDQILLRQSALIARAMGTSESAVAQSTDVQKQIYAVLKANPDPAIARQKLTALVSAQLAALPASAREAAQKEGDAQLATFLSPWFRFFVSYDPVPTLRNVRCPVLALNGSKDMQVPPQEDLAAIHAALKAGGNKDFTTREMPGLNHLFQTCQTGVPSEYGGLEETFSPTALQVIGRWIGKHTTAPAPAAFAQRRH